MPHLGSLPFKKWLTYMFAAVAVAFLYSLLSTTITHAADATWDNGSIRYQNAAFNGPQTANGDTSNGLQFANGVKYFYSDEGGKRKIISFDANQDPATATQARYVEYNFSPPDRYTNQTGAKSISIEQNPDGGSGDNENKEQTSCAVNGIGYILCPIMGFMADAMDWVFELIKGFLEVRPLSSDTNSSLYKAWSMMRSFANVAFVIAFLVFVYAYLTSMAMSAYDIQKMIPRLIIAAILVNTSYYLCAVLVDLSNVAGASLQDVFVGIRDQLAQENTQENKLDGLSWSTMTAYLLSGGTVAAAGLVYFSGVGAGAIYMLVPILIAAAVAIFVTLAVLAARQALIIILIVIAPIAFVAFVLPGTQKYFDKWKDLFQTMLLMYPMFALLFGGSQLAGYLISQNASRPELLVLAMFVQVAPLIITPFLIKFSGGLLGKFAGIVNNPTKGALDKSKKWASDKQDLQRTRRIANNSLGSGLARRLDDGRRRDEALKKRYETRRNRKFNSSDLGQSLAVKQSLEDDRLTASDNLNKAAYEEMKRTDPKVRIEAAQVKIAEMQLNVNKAQAETYLEELQTSKGGAMHGANDVAVRALSTRMRKIAQTQQVDANAASIASDEKKADYANDMVNSRALQRAAAGVGGTSGEMLAMARATQAIRKDFGQGVDASTELIKHFNLNGTQLHQLAMGGNGIVGHDSSGRSFTFNSSELEMHEAAIMKDMKENNYKGVSELLMASGRADFKHVRSTIKDNIMANGIQNKAAFTGGQSIDLVGQGMVKDQASFNRLIGSTVGKGKIDQNSLATNDADAIKQIVDFTGIYNQAGPKNWTAMGLTGAENRGTRQVLDQRMHELYVNAYETLTNPRLASMIKDNAREHLLELAILSGRDRSKLTK